MGLYTKPAQLRFTAAGSFRGGTDGQCHMSCLQHAPGACCRVTNKCLNNQPPGCKLNPATSSGLVKSGGVLCGHSGSGKPEGVLKHQRFKHFKQRLIGLRTRSRVAIQSGMCQKGPLFSFGREGLVFLSWNGLGETSWPLNKSKGLGAFRFGFHGNPSIVCRISFWATLDPPFSKWGLVASCVFLPPL